MSKAIRELERKKQEEERRKMMQKFYAPPTTPPYAPPRMLPMKHSSNSAVSEVVIGAIADEATAIVVYESLARGLEYFNLWRDATTVRAIIEDERRHKELLMDMQSRVKNI